MRISFLALLLLPLAAWGQITVETGVSRQPVSLGGGIRLAIPDYDPDAVAYFSRPG